MKLAAGQQKHFELVSRCVSNDRACAIASVGNGPAGPKRPGACFASAFQKDHVLPSTAWRISRTRHSGPTNARVNHTSGKHRTSLKPQLFHGVAKGAANRCRAGALRAAGIQIHMSPSCSSDVGGTLSLPSGIQSCHDAVDVGVGPVLAEFGLRFYPGDEQFDADDGA